MPEEIFAPAKSEKPKFSFNYAPIILDNALRWATLAIWNRQWLNDHGFWFVQLFVIPLAVWLLTIVRADSVANHHGQSKAEGVEVDFSAAAITILVVLWTVGAYLDFRFIELRWQWLEIIVAAFVSLLYALYIAVIANFSLGRPVQPDVTKPASTFLQRHDENDTVIAGLETDRAVVFQRVDTYTLEATLLGAISFSAFVSIVASDKDVAIGVQPLLEFAGQVVVDFSAGQFSLGNAQTIVRDKWEVSLLAAMAMEALVCTAFFLSVLIARIRFMYAIRGADFCIRLAAMMNAKEEDVVNLSLANPQTSAAINARLDEIRENITQAIDHAEQSLAKLRPFVMYMTLCRNLGVLSFLVTLVTGALWFSQALSAVFAVVCLAAFLYPYVDRFREKAGNPTLDYIARHVPGRR